MKILCYAKGEITPEDAEAVEEFPVPLIVNDRELATLVASPHDLTFLVAGFLRLQGFVSSRDDFEVLSVCKDFGAARVRIKGELPERLRPVLTSGCGTGITFSTPRALPICSQRRYSPGQVFSLMDELARQAHRYRCHGGIHSAAVGDGERLLLYAEDLGRHNTIDRIAGEALLKGIDLDGCMLVTSGRISTEMVAKAAQLGIALLASRTSPTDLAVKLGEESGIAMIGYVRAGRFQIYCHPERLILPEKRIKGVAGLILAGGNSSRMGRNKALLPYRGRPLIESIYLTMAELFETVAVVTNSPDDYRFLPCPKIPDIHVGMGSIAGIHAGLSWSPEESVFVVGCDMPFLDGRLVRWLASRHEGRTATIPLTPAGFEPLHAFYSKGVLAALDGALRSGQRRIVDLLGAMEATVVPAEEIGEICPDFSSFTNLNTPEDYSNIS